MLNTFEQVAKEYTTGIETQNENSYQNKPKLWPELDLNALHGLAGDFVETIEPETESDNVALLVQFLITFGNVIGRCPHFIAEADKHFTIGNVCLVGETAKGKKGSSLGHVQRCCKGLPRGSYR